MRRSSHRRYSVKKAFPKYSQYSQENINKNRLWDRCFSVNIAKFLRTSILKNICKRLLLHELQKFRKTIKIRQKIGALLTTKLFWFLDLHIFPWYSWGRLKCLRKKNTWFIFLNRSSHQRYFGKFTGKHLCQSLLLNKVTGLRHLFYRIPLGDFFSFKPSDFWQMKCF